MSKIFNFSDRRAGKPLKVLNKSATKAEIIIYDSIGFDWWTGGGVTAKSFSEELKNIADSVTEIEVRINSPGGDVFDGIAIYNRLKQHKAKKKVYIDGLAASIASIIALAGDEIIIGEGALYMVHLPWTFAFGNRMELENTIGRLLDIEEQMIGIYARKSGLGRTEIKALLEAETWMDADEAIEKGFVDTKIESSIPIAASAIESRWITRRPKNYNSETKAVSAAVEDLKKKIQGRLARK